MDLPKFKTPPCPYRPFHKLVCYYLASQLKRKRKASTTAKTQPVLKKGRGCLKGLRNQRLQQELRYIYGVKLDSLISYINHTPTQPGDLQMGLRRTTVIKFDL